MPVFRYYGFDRRGAILAGEYFEASDFNDAVTTYRETARQSIFFSYFDRIEIWQGSDLVYQTTAPDEQTHAARPSEGRECDECDNELLALRDEVQRVAQTIPDPAIVAELAEIAEQLFELSDIPAEVQVDARGKPLVASMNSLAAERQSLSQQTPRR